MGITQDLTDVLRGAYVIKEGSHFSPVMARLVMESISNASSMQSALKQARILRVRAHQWVSEYEGDYPGFRLDWLVARMLVPLQVRLLVEQILYEKGEPWSKLCSGFSPA